MINLLLSLRQKDDWTVEIERHRFNSSPSLLENETTDWILAELNQCGREKTGVERDESSRGTGDGSRNGSVSH